MASLEVATMSTLAAEVEVNFSPLVHRYTLEEFWELPDPGDLSHYELIGSQLFLVPPPDPPHGIDARLLKSLMRFAFVGRLALFPRRRCRVQGA